MSDKASLLEPLIPALRRYAWALTRDHARADDLVQDCLERALSRWLLRRPDTDLRAWLFTILHNQFISGQRMQRRRPLHDVLGEANEHAAATPATQEAGLLGHDILAQLASLSEDHKAVLLLVGVEGLDYATVSRVLGVPIGTVMSRLSRARDQFRRMMDGDRPTIRPAIRRVK